MPFPTISPEFAHETATVLVEPCRFGISQRPPETLRAAGRSLGVLQGVLRGFQLLQLLKLQLGGLDGA